MPENWKRYLNRDPLEWLLEEDNPSVRYHTLRRLLGRGDVEPEVSHCRKNIMHHGPVPKILGSQKKGGYWEEPEDFYIRTKYRGTVWQFIILAELGADGKDRRIGHTCEFILHFSPF